MSALPGFRQLADNQAAEWSKLPDGVDEPPYVKHMRAANKYRTLSNSTKLWWSATLALVPALAVVFALPDLAKWAVASMLVICFARTVQMAMNAARAHSEASKIDEKASRSIVEIEPEKAAPEVGSEAKA